jgi:hypothetical protein
MRTYIHACHRRRRIHAWARALIHEMLPRRPAEIRGQKNTNTNTSSIHLYEFSWQVYFIRQTQTTAPEIDKI